MKSVRRMSPNLPRQWWHLRGISTPRSLVATAEHWTSEVYQFDQNHKVVLRGGVTLMVKPCSHNRPFLSPLGDSFSIPSPGSAIACGGEVVLLFAAIRLLVARHV